MIFQNVVIGSPLVEPWTLISIDKETWDNFDSKYTLFTEERFLPKILVDAGIAKSNSEVRKNKPELVKTLDTLDCIDIKWGKKRLYIIIGE